MNDQFIHGDPHEDAPRFVSCALFEKFGIQRVFYKGDAPEVKETKEEQALAEIAGAKWNYYQDNYKPIENEYMKRVDSMDTDGAYDFVSGAAASATSAAFAEPKTRMQEDLRSAGINPNSGKFKASMTSLSDAQGLSSADSISRATVDQQDQFVQGVSNISAMGKGQATTAQNGASDVAGLSASKAQDDAANAWNNKSARNSAMGAVAGAGASVFANSGGLSNSAPGASASDYTGPAYKDWAANQ